MSNYIVNSDDLDTVADAIRQKSGSSAAMTFPDGFASQIQSIPTGSGGGFTPTVLTCTADYADATETDGGIQIETTLTSGTYAAALAAAQAGTPAVLQITLQETEDGTTTTLGAVNVFLTSVDDSDIGGGLQMDDSVVSAAVASDGSVSVKICNTAAGDIFWVDAVMDLQTFTLSNVSHSYSQILDAYNAGKEIKVRTMYYTSPSTYEYTISDLRTYQVSENRFIFNTTFANNFGSGYAPYMLITKLDSNDQTSIDVFYLSGTQVT